MTSTPSLPTILKTDTRGRIRTPAKDREALLALYDQGSMSGATFARTYGLRYSTFMAWLCNRRRQAVGEEDGPAFREVVITPPPACSGLLVELPLGVRVRLERADQIPMLGALSRHLHEASPC